MTLPWLKELWRRDVERENRMRASIIAGVNAGYVGSKDKEGNRQMREILEKLQQAG